MLFMLCRNRVQDVNRWKAVFDSHAEAHRNAGLKLLFLWRSVDRPDEVHFLFSVESRERALAFVSDPAGEEAGRRAGVIDGEVHLLTQLQGY